LVDEMLNEEPLIPHDALFTAAAVLQHSLLP
jgi:hypothetical protein